MKVSHSWLQTYFDKPIPAAPKLAELFTFHSFEVEGVADDVLDLKILPDRAHYCLSHKGVAEEIAVLTKAPLKNKNSDAEVTVAGKRVPTVTIEDPNFCRRFTGRFVENIDVKSATKENGEKIAHIADSLAAIGQRSIHPIVDVTNFVMFDIGQPTHAFDADKIQGNIVIRAAKEGEKITLLDGKEYTLTAQDHVIADDAGPLDIAGVKGGKRAEVTDATRNILLTSANFNPSAIRRTSTRLGLRNEASKRFENEITQELTIEGLSALSALLHEIFPAAQFGPIVEEYPTKAVRANITIKPAYISERLGVAIPEETIKDILNRMGIENISTGDSWKLTIPFERLDLVIQEDIVEEVGRIYGYEHVKGAVLSLVSPPSSASTASSSPLGSRTFYLSEKIKNILADAGFSEVYLYTLVPKGDIRVAYPLASDKAALRTTLTAGISKCLEMNAKNAELLGLDAVCVFEIGKIFTKNADGNDAETLTLALGATQVKKVKGIDGSAIVKDAVKKLSDGLGIELPIRSLLSSGPNAVCEIELDGVLRSITEKIDVSGVIGDGASKKISYTPFSVYPFIVRDIAVFVPESGEGHAASDDVWKEIAQGVDDADAAEILVRHSLFDTFTKDGKTSYAFRLIFQAMDRTLTDGEVYSVMGKIYTRISERTWQVR